MAFVRYAVMTPKPGQDGRVRRLLDEMLEYQRGRAGFVAAWRLEPDDHGDQGFIGRVSVWESERQANAVAQEQHEIALQSELKLWVVDETHEERAFRAERFEPRAG